MRGFLTAAVLAGSVFAAPGAAEARGCIIGAIVGGIAGHAVHHGVAGAAAGCAAGSGASHHYRTHDNAALKSSQGQATPGVAQ